MSAAAGKPGYLAVYYTPLTAQGGVVQAIKHLLAAAADSFHPRFHLLDWQRRTPDFVPDSETGVDTWRYPLASPVTSEKRFTPRTVAAFLLRLIPALRTIGAQLDGARVSIVHLHAPELAALHYALLRRWRGGFRLIYTLHGSEVTEALTARGVRRWLWSWLLRQCDGGAAVSAELQRRLVDGFPEVGNCGVVLSGVPAEDLRRRAARQPVPPLPAAVVFTAVGAFRQVKGYDILLAAFAEVRRRHPDCALELIGAAGEWSALVPEWIREQGLEHAVTVRENVPHAEALSYLARASVAVLPSRLEGLPTVLLEAGALGRAVVATRVGGVPLLIDDQANGLLVPPEDPAALAAALLQLAGDAALRDRLGSALRATVEERFTLAGAWRQYLNLSGS